MSPVPNVVYVIVDREFGEKLSELESGVPVWRVDTPTNKAVVHRLWREKSKDRPSAITTFKFAETASPEDIFLAELQTVDLHHGAYSADPPYAVLQVIGTSLNPRIKDKLSAYGFNEFHETPEGFKSRVGPDDFDLIRASFR